MKNHLTCTKLHKCHRTRLQRDWSERPQPALPQRCPCQHFHQRLLASERCTSHVWTLTMKSHSSKTFFKLH